MSEAVLELKRRLEESGRQPDFRQLIRVFGWREPTRPTPFEFVICDEILEDLADLPSPPESDALGWCRFLVKGFAAAGYDCAMIGGWRLNALVFPGASACRSSPERSTGAALIRDRQSLGDYHWPDPEVGDFSPLVDAARELPAGMRMVVSSPAGILETVISLVGYESLCFMTYDDPALTIDIFRAVGSRILRFYERVLELEAVVALVANDEWGFGTQTALSPAALRRLVFPWYRRIVHAAHQVGKPVILHSGGNLQSVMDEIVEGVRFDAKHGYSEKAYREWGERIAFAGGVDVDFLANSSASDIQARIRDLIELSAPRGGLAIGSDDSIQAFVSPDRYAAMQAAVLFQ